MSLDERREAVKELTENGKTQRQIAGVLGVDHKTVHNDQHGENSPKDPSELYFSGENSPDVKEEYRKRREDCISQINPPLLELAARLSITLTFKSRIEKWRLK